MICHENLPLLLDNPFNLYEGNLVHYYQVILFRAQNLKKGYHNFRHMFQVAFNCYEACEFYQENAKQLLSPLEMRKLLVAALFHDFDHSGLFGHDDLNLKRAVRGFEKHVQECDKPFIGEIGSIMWETKFPYENEVDDLPLVSKIIRDADMGQTFSEAWIQQVIMGLSEEWNMAPIDVLKSQPKFLSELRFHTSWGQKKFPQSVIDRKIAESQALIEMAHRKLP